MQKGNLFSFHFRTKNKFGEAIVTNNQDLKNRNQELFCTFAICTS